MRKFSKILDGISRAINEALAEETFDMTDVIQVICDKLSIGALPMFKHENEGEYSTDSINAVYVNNVLTRALSEKQWKYFDFFRKDDNNMARAKYSYFNNKDIKELYSRYVYNNVKPCYDEISGFMKGLTKKQRDILNDVKPDWVYISPDGGIMVYKSGAIYAKFTGSKTYSKVDSQKIQKLKDADSQSRSDRMKSVMNTLEKRKSRLNYAIDSQFDITWKKHVPAEIPNEDTIKTDGLIYKVPMPLIYSNDIEKSVDIFNDNLRKYTDMFTQRGWTRNDDDMFVSPDRVLKMAFYTPDSKEEHNIKLCIHYELNLGIEETWIQDLLSKYDIEYRYINPSFFYRAEKFDKETIIHGFVKSNHYVEQYRDFAKKRMKDAVLIRAIYDYVPDKMKEAGIFLDSIYTIEHYNGMGWRIPTVQVKDGKIYFESVKINHMLSQQMMLNISENIGIKQFYEFVGDWNGFKYSTKPIDITKTEYYIEYGDPDSFGVCNGNIRSKPRE